MISPISFTPSDPLMAEWGNTLKILNEFRNLGFASPAAFVEVVQSHDPEYNQFKKYQQLLSFWNMRLRNKAVNADLLTVLEKLKAE
jgi:hypothetical protein